VKSYKNKVSDVISNYTKYAKYAIVIDKQDEEILRKYRLICFMLGMNVTDTTIDERIDLTYSELTKNVITRLNKLKKI
jgi:hypothetical protein